ncbi:hypothetical protein LS482_08905 [Sinomicrobium kalidii]|uniref:hypothetical protein n=1 Tax=Sinomicrobium kalidii TaxID=2900738 RepID=UPI001E299868|nr:hypothetical protein [Sinomicrobium kalidii]UGU17987.1 hypothetical protein LS482_08905 [Sinomicrobium kalidii]
MFFSLIHTYGQITEEGIISTGDAGGNHAFTGTHSNATFDNWMNTGYSGTAYNLLGYSNPHAGFGIVDGNNIVSPIIWMYAHSRNAFIVKTMNYLGDMTSGADLFTVRANGNVGIGTTNPQSKLAVKGQIRATEVKVLANISVPDYVFEPDYKLHPLKEVQEYIEMYKHLPEIPSAKEIEKEGIDLGNMNMRLLKKIEELTLYQIELLGRLEEMERRIGELEWK